jgi:hypothetical protein
MCANNDCSNLLSVVLEDQNGVSSSAFEPVPFYEGPPPSLSAGGRFGASIIQYHNVVHCNDTSTTSTINATFGSATASEHQGLEEFRRIFGSSSLFHRGRAVLVQGPPTSHCYITDGCFLPSSSCETKSSSPLRYHQHQHDSKKPALNPTCGILPQVTPRSGSRSNRELIIHGAADPHDDEQQQQVVVHRQQDHHYLSTTSSVAADPSPPTPNKNSNGEAHLVATKDLAQLTDHHTGRLRVADAAPAAKRTKTTTTTTRKGTGILATPPSSQHSWCYLPDRASAVHHAALIDIHYQQCTNNEGEEETNAFLSASAGSNKNDPAGSDYANSSLVLQGAANIPSMTHREEQWHERFQELGDFKRYHGHCCVPIHWPQNPPLAKWVKRQRYQYKMKKDGKSSSMIQDRETALDQLGFIWDSHAAVWDERLKELRAFHDIHGNFLVPTTYPENPQLAAWVKRQRYCSRLRTNTRESTMAMGRVRTLKTMLGFAWDRPCRKKPPPKVEEEVYEQGAVACPTSRR